MVKSYTRYIFFSDLHSNYHALERFYEYLKTLDEECKVFFLGDLVGYYNFDYRIIDIFHRILNEYKLTLILGNHDAKFLNEYFNTSYNVNCTIPFHGSILKDSSMRSAIKELLQLAKIKEETMIFNRKTIISHGGILDPLNDYYYPDLKFLGEKGNIHENNTDYIFGHTHHCFIHEDNINNNRFINIGSLGMPRNKEVYGSFLDMRPTNLKINKILYNLDMQFEFNKDLPNEIKNRIYFGGNSKFISIDLKDFSIIETNKLIDSKFDVEYYKKLILIGNKTKVLKAKSGYLLVRGSQEKEYTNLELLIKELENET